ncbi:MAG: signal recognition particle protein [Hydrotalea sp.]|nr:signal recognition particle protein [Hydrotalea sp.]
MFDNLGKKLQAQFRQLTSRGVLSEKDVDNMLAEVRLALLEADVALPVVTTLLADIRGEAIGQKVLASIRPGDAVVKIVHDSLVKLLATKEGAGARDKLLNPKTTPHIMMMVGLQGSGKTTSTVKLAKWLDKNKKGKTLVASLDIYRPAAQEQLAVFAKKNDVASLEIVAGEEVTAIANRAVKAAKQDGYDYLLLDTAGRLTLDKELMNELVGLKKTIKPKEILLVLDGLSGQSAIQTAKGFNDPLSLSGAMMTRMDGDARGGAALSLAHETGCPLWFVGTGEGADKLELFDGARVAGQILGMGDIVALVERAQDAADEDDMAEMEARFKKGLFTLVDMQKQIRQMKKMGGMKEILGMLPQGLLPQNVKNLQNANLDDTVFARQDAIINSMTPRERERPDIILASRKNRIAKGAGVQLADVNRLLKQFMTTQKMMKQAGKMDQAQMMRQMQAMKGQMPRGFR